MSNRCGDVKIVSLQPMFTEVTGDDSSVQQFSVRNAELFADSQDEAQSLDVLSQRDSIYLSSAANVPADYQLKITEYDTRGT